MGGSFLPLPLGRRVRLAHNENAFVGQSVKAYVQSRVLATAFPNVAELEKAIEFNTLWTMDVVLDDSSTYREFAAHNFVTLLHAAKCGLVEVEPIGLEVVPPLPHHDALVLECSRDVESELWTMSWRDGVARASYQLRSSSLRSVFVRALEISAGNSAAKLEAFERSFIVH